MEKACERCKTVTITDEDHRICFDCFVELDIGEYNEDSKKDSTGSLVIGMPVVVCEEE